MTSLIKIMNDEQAKAQKAHEKRQIILIHIGPLDTSRYI